MGASRGVSTSALTPCSATSRDLFLTGLVTSLTGPIGFVGLIVPHALRLKLGADHRMLMPCSFLLGAAFLCTLRYTVANGDRADGNSGGRCHGARRRTVFHLAAAVEAEEPVAVILVGGGARSGKSRYALDNALAIADRVGSWRPPRPSMKRWPLASRRHRADRGARSSRPSRSRSNSRGHRQDTNADAIVVDCLTLWLSNVMFDVRPKY